MNTSRQEIAEWFDAGKSRGEAFMIVACDTYDYSDFPVYVRQGQAFWAAYSQYDCPANMLRIMEVYDLRQDREEQLNEHRAMRCPPRSAS